LKQLTLTKTTENMTTITIGLGNVGSKEQAEKIFQKVNGKTYYNFQVQYSPDAGNYPVIVFTDYKNADEQEVRDMLMFVMACEL